MATSAQVTSSAPAVTSGATGDMRYVARQPILNLRGHVHGYELLFRNASEAILNPDLAGQRNPGADRGIAPTAEVAACTMLDNAVIFGLDWLTNGLPAFVPCTVETLNEDLVLVLAPAKTVLEIPCNLEPTARLLDSCHKLKSRGFRLALEDFNWSAEWRSLAKLADYIRVDFNRFGPIERE